MFTGINCNKAQRSEIVRAGTAHGADRRRLGGSHRPASARAILADAFGSPFSDPFDWRKRRASAPCGRCEPPRRRRPCRIVRAERFKPPLAHQRIEPELRSRPTRNSPRRGRGAAFTPLQREASRTVRSHRTVRSVNAACLPRRSGNRPRLLRNSGWKYFCESESHFLRRTPRISRLKRVRNRPAGTTAWCSLGPERRLPAWRDSDSSHPRAVPEAGAPHATQQQRQAPASERRIFVAFRRLLPPFAAFRWRAARRTGTHSRQCSARFYCRRP